MEGQQKLIEVDSFEVQAWTADAQQKGNIEAALRVLIVEALDPRGIGVSVR